MIELLLLGGIPAGLWALERLRRRQIERSHESFLATLDDDVKVVLHVAQHEARSREQNLHPLHLAYGLLQDEKFQDVIKSVGGECEAIESAIHAALDAPTHDATGRDAIEALAYVSAVAAHLGRPATAGELWARLARNTEIERVFEVGGLPAHKLLFALIHGHEPPALRLPAPSPGHVHVVLRNDDVTTVEFVMMVLREVFGLDAATAKSVTMATHTDGRAVVGRFSPDIAADRVEAARARAKQAGFPLWVGIEPC